MRKRYLYLVFFMTLLLVGCTIKPIDKEDVDFHGKESIESKYEFMHGVVDYNFETWEFNDTSLKFEYEITNHEKEAQFGLIFLIDGLPQEYTSNGNQTIMETIDMGTGDKKTLSIELIPQINRELSETNLNPVLILNPSQKIDELNKYGVNHLISSTATIRLKINSTPNLNTILNRIEISSIYDEIDNETLSMFVKDDINMLESNVYIQNTNDVGDISTIKNGETIELSILGKEGEYRLLTVKDQNFTDSYSVNILDGKITHLEIKPDLKNITNLYFLIIPTDVQDIHEYIMINQSSRWIVK